MSPPITLAEIEAAVRQLAHRRERAADPAQLERAARTAASTRRPFTASLQEERFSVIAEIKRASPSAGALRATLDPVALARDYFEHGARALSVLTCEPWFEGFHGDLVAARAAAPVPVLCKDFLVTPFQVIEAAASADAILLIAALLEPRELVEFGRLARELRLEVLFEAHDEPELDAVLAAGATLVGINSRDLRTMRVLPEVALSLGAKLPASVHGVYESGIKTPDELRAARDHGYRSALIGETLLRAAHPGAALRELLTRAGFARTDVA